MRTMNFASRHRQRTVHRWHDAPGVVDDLQPRFGRSHSLQPLSCPRRCRRRRRSVPAATGAERLLQRVGAKGVDVRALFAAGHDDAHEVRGGHQRPPRPVPATRRAAAVQRRHRIHCVSRRPSRWMRSRFGVPSRCARTSSAAARQRAGQGGDSSVIGIGRDTGGHPQAVVVPSHSRLAAGRWPALAGRSHALQHRHRSGVAQRTDTDTLHCAARPASRRRRTRPWKVTWSCSPSLRTCVRSAARAARRPAVQVRRRVGVGLQQPAERGDDGVDTVVVVPGTQAGDANPGYRPRARGGKRDVSAPSGCAPPAGAADRRRWRRPRSSESPVTSRRA